MLPLALLGEQLVYIVNGLLIDVLLDLRSEDGLKLPHVKEQGLQRVELQNAVEIGLANLVLQVFQGQVEALDLREHRVDLLQLGGLEALVEELQVAADLLELGEGPQVALHPLQL